MSHQRLSDEAILNGFRMGNAFIIREYFYRYCEIAKSWLINGFRYVVLDALKWYKKEYGSITFEDYLRSFDVTSDLRLRFNKMVEDV